MSKTNWPGAFQSDDPIARDPRWQRRVVDVRRPFSFIENVNEVELECGHDPLVLGDQIPVVGGLQFCPDCYEASKNERTE